MYIYIYTNVSKFASQFVCIRIYNYLRLELAVR